MALAYVDKPCRRHASRWCFDRRCNPVVRYDRRQVEALLMALWNDGVIPQDEVIEAGQPRAKANPATLGNGQAALIDIRRAWSGVALKHEVGWALFAHYGNGLTVEEVARRQGLETGAVQMRIIRAVTKLQDWLNGRDYEEVDDEDRH